MKGQPRFIYTDSGSQLKAAKNQLEQETIKGGVNWQQVADETAHLAIHWKCAPPEAQWRDGKSERAVAALKKTLKHLYDPRSILNYAELETLLWRAADCINERPLGVHHAGGEDPHYYPVTPNGLLKGSRTQPVSVDLAKYISSDKKYLYREEHMNNMFDAWWEAWFRDVFDSLLPYPKWRQSHTNLQVGDICVIKYAQKVGLGDFRLCRVIGVEKDDHNLVRTVKIAMRPRNVREKILPYKSKQLVEMTVPVQRLILVNSAAEEAAREAAAAQVNTVQGWTVHDVHDVYDLKR